MKHIETRQKSCNHEGSCEITCWQPIIHNIAENEFAAKTFDGSAIYLFSGFSNLRHDVNRVNVYYCRKNRDRKYLFFHYLEVFFQ